MIDATILSGGRDNPFGMLQSALLFDGRIVISILLLAFILVQRLLARPGRP